MCIVKQNIQVVSNGEIKYPDEMGNITWPNPYTGNEMQYSKDIVIGSAEGFNIRLCICVCIYTTIGGHTLA